MNVRLIISLCDRSLRLAPGLGRLGHWTMNSQHTCSRELFVSETTRDVKAASPRVLTTMFTAAGWPVSVPLDLPTVNTRDLA